MRYKIPTAIENYRRETEFPNLEGYEDQRKLYGRTSIKQGLERWGKGVSSAKPRRHQS